MTQQAGGSSMRGSSPAQRSAKVFDITHESEMLALLRQIHRSDLKQALKNKLRDVLFEYKNNGPEDQKFVTQILADAGFAVTFSSTPGSVSGETSTAALAPVSKRGAGWSRQVPRFTPPAAVETTPAAIKTSTVVPESVATPAPVEPPSVTSSSVPPEPPPVVATASAVPEVVAPASAPVAAAPVAPTPPVPPPVPPVAPEPIPTVPVPPAAAIPVAPTPTTEGAQAMERIKEIKRLVNQKVGNPVTLIDIDNQIGREYMNALLGAMKIINGGRPEELQTAMARLEKAYSAAIAIAHDLPATAPATTAENAWATATNGPGSDTVPPPPQQPAPPPTEPSPTPAAGDALSQVTPLRAVASSRNPAAGVPVSGVAAGSPSDAQPVPVKINISSTSSDAAQRAVPSAGVDLSAVAGMPPQQSPTDAAPVTSDLQEVASALKSDAVIAPSTILTTPQAVPGSAEATGARLMSVAKEEQLQKLMRQNQAAQAQQQQAAEMQDRTNTDPLMLPEVTAGLKQLLSEWSLFKGSGFFGTGPSGADHPLYKQIAGLTMAAVIAGRFEGATPAVKQSITDYMNGWRYEEGIVHEHTETFEHYLRRVIRHILDKKTPAV